MADEIIELHALGRLEDPELRSHLDTCRECRARVIKYGEYLEALRYALRECGG